MPLQLSTLPRCVAGVCCLLAFALRANAVETWTKVTSPSFTLLSSAPESDTLDWAVEFEAFFTEVGATLPASKQVRAPLTILLFPKDEAVRPWKPLFEGRPHPSAALTFRLRSGSVVLMSAKDPDKVQRRLIYHDGVHWAMGAQGQRYPLWFQEGLAELFSSFEVAGGQRSLGMPIATHTAILKREPLMPMAAFLGVARDSWQYNEVTRTNLFYAQAWAFAHVMYLNRDTALRTGAMKYLAQPPAAPTEEAFRAAFGTGYAEMEQRIGAHVKAGRYGVSKMPVDRAALLAKLRREPAAEGDLELALGRVRFAQRSYDEAARLLQTAQAAKPHAAAAWLALAEIALARNDHPTALQHLDASIGLGMDLECAYFWRGWVRMKLEAPAGKRLDPEQARLIADDLIAAARRNPGDFETIQLLAGPLGFAKPRQPEDRVILEHAVKRWPTEALFHMNLAAIDVEEGRADEARRGWERVVALPLGVYSPLRKQAEALLAAKAAQDTNADFKRLHLQRDHAGLRARIQEELRNGSPINRARLEQSLRALDQREATDRAIALAASDKNGASEALAEVLTSRDADLETKTEARMQLERLRKEAAKVE
ncbi:MAG: tetratricopeptide repeat protein [Verrucomicrobiota bacterium]